METRIALVGIIVENLDKVEEVNHILHDFGQFIIGRMGLPIRDQEMNIISIVVEADNNTINSLSGKLGMLEGINVKTVYSKAGANQAE
ncbi:TM1266 family iron-only hydrogenase system putative regulator [Anaerocolumna xylanovorans]|uniref:Putative iron-only hydrogenase system regulator n=1 Tax=Anaerocolumna xylanovorans DSM 12503 TaxID=1121345 RepID=A0A1M7YK55_9FIRM|nr:TM1266 family iron-only hydrogenase system putative regulator [Anaerocolumna xylanovorans]SHO53009.1 putative iron-only hydrogenase system regulator [Anaerocolumna xylanovorans DSM 12503]